MSDYHDFIKSKTKKNIETGIKGFTLSVNGLFDFQNDIVSYCLKLGRAAIFADCGMGKTIMQLAWAKTLVDHENLNVLILAPLAVATQTVREGAKFGVNLEYCREKENVKPGITITNYEMLKNFDADYFDAVVLDESSILKSFTGKIRNEIIDKFKKTRFKLACTATPAPNDFMELGNHSEFLGVMSREEMLSMFFVHDGGETSKWRLKGHAETPFWKWLCSWAVNIRKPSDLGYEDGGFILPDIEFVHHVVKKDQPPEGFLFQVKKLTLSERQKERRATIKDRAEKCSEIVNSTNEPFIVWCNMNDESKMIKDICTGMVEVTGSDKPEFKEKTLIGFTNKDPLKIVSKPSIAGYGMNWQHCSNMAFLGLSDSFEQMYQAVRRCWRFGQKNKVTVHVVTAETEGDVVKNIERKEEQARKMADEMVKYMCEINRYNIRGTEAIKTNYNPVVEFKPPSFI